MISYPIGHWNFDMVARFFSPWNFSQFRKSRSGFCCSWSTFEASWSDSSPLSGNIQVSRPKPALNFDSCKNSTCLLTTSHLENIRGEDVKTFSKRALTAVAPPKECPATIELAVSSLDLRPVKKSRLGTKCANSICSPALGFSITSSAWKHSSTRVCIWRMINTGNHNKQSSREKLSVSAFSWVLKRNILEFQRIWICCWVLVFFWGILPTKIIRYL